MTVQFNSPNGPGPLAKVVAFLIALFTALALFGFAVLIWIVATLTEGGGGTDVFLTVVGMVT